MSELAIEKMSITSDPTGTDCIVMICCGPNRELVPYCRIGDTSWTLFERLPSPYGFCDLVYCQKDKLFYAINDDFHMEAFDLVTNPSSSRRFDFSIDECEEGASEYGYEIIEKKSFGRRIYLVESPQGDMLEVTKYLASVGEDGFWMPCYLKHRCRSVYFHVMKLDSQKQTGVLVDDLDNTAFSLSVRDYPQLCPNSIYFADDGICFIYNSRYPYGGIYNHNEESVSPLYQPFQFTKMIPPPLWVSGA